MLPSPTLGQLARLVVQLQPRVTGVVRWPGLIEAVADDYIMTWGAHPGTSRITDPPAIGAGLVYQPEDVDRVIESELDIQLVTPPTHYLCVWISTGWADDPQGIDSAEDFERHLRELAAELVLQP